MNLLTLTLNPALKSLKNICFTFVLLLLFTGSALAQKAVRVSNSNNALLDPIASDFAAANGFLLSSGTNYQHHAAILDNIAANAFFGTLATGGTNAATFRTLIGTGTSNFSGAFSDLTSKPTTLSGYGITDGQPLNSLLTTLGSGIIPLDSFTLTGTGQNPNFKGSTLSGTTTFQGITSASAVALVIDGAGTISERSGTNAQGIRIFSSYTGNSNNESLYLGGWDGVSEYVLTTKTGTGVLHDLQVGVSGKAYTIYSASGSMLLSTPVSQDIQLIPGGSLTINGTGLGSAAFVNTGPGEGNVPLFGSGGSFIANGYTTVGPLTATFSSNTYPYTLHKFQVTGTNYIDNVADFYNATGGFSAITFTRGGDSSPTTAIGITSATGKGEYTNTFYLATNGTAGGDNPPNIVIGQHKNDGTPYTQHDRILFDGSSHIITAYGWSTSDYRGPLGWLVRPDGTVIINGTSAYAGAQLSALSTGTNLSFASNGTTFLVGRIKTGNNGGYLDAASQNPWLVNMNSYGNSWLSINDRTDANTNKEGVVASKSYDSSIDVGMLYGNAISGQYRLYIGGQPGNAGLALPTSIMLDIGNGTTTSGTDIVTITGGGMTVNTGALTLSTGTFNGNGAGLTNVTAADSSKVAGAPPGTGVATFIGTPSSANLAAAVTDEVGTAGSLVFSNGPPISNISMSGTSVLSGTLTNNGVITGGTFNAVTTTGTITLNGSLAASGSQTVISTVQLGQTYLTGSNLVLGSGSGSAAKLEVSSVIDVVTNPDALTSWNIVSRYNAATNAKATGIGFAVGVDGGYSMGGGIGFQRQGSGGYGDLVFYTKASGGSVAEKMRLSSGGDITLTGGIVGVTGTGTATAGNIGEYVSASIVSGSALALTTATPKTITSISLTAGDWDVTAIGSITGASTGTEFDVAVSSTNNSMTGTVLGDTRAQTPTVSLAGADATLMIPTFRVSGTATTTYYLIIQETFTVGSPSGYGRISARRSNNL